MWDTSQETQRQRRKEIGGLAPDGKRRNDFVKKSRGVQAKCVIKGAIRGEKGEGGGQARRAVTNLLDWAVGKDCRKTVV